MRYYFHFEKGSSVLIDHIGQDFPDIRSARAHAGELAHKLAEGELPHGWAVRVVDASNTEVFWLPVNTDLISR